MRIRHILFFLVGVQLMINGVFFTSSLLTAVGAGLICLFILLAAKRPHAWNGNGHHPTDLGPTYHHMSWGRKETYFAPIALIALIAGALAYLFLPLEDIYAKTAVTLAWTGLLYLLLASFAHGFRITIKNVLGILFGGLFLLGAWATIAMRRTPIKIEAQSMIAKIKTMTGNLSDRNTGSENMTTLSGENIDISTGASMSEETGLVDTTLNIPLMGSGDIAITYGQLIPYIVNKYGLTSTGKTDITFTMFPNHDNRYQAFKSAYYHRFFGRTVDPEKKVSCDNYIVFIGLAEKWPLSYTPANVYSVFRGEAERRWILYGCKKWAYVKRANLF